MKVYIYEGTDRSLLNQKARNNGKSTKYDVVINDASKGAMIVAYPDQTSSSGSTGSINIQYVCRNCEPVKLMKYGGWQAALIVNVMIIVVVILWCAFVRCGQRQRGRDQVYCEGQNDTEVKLVESKSKKMFLFHNSRVENPTNSNKLYVEELTLSQYGRKQPQSKTASNHSKPDLSLLEYNMTTQNNVTQVTGAADNTSSNIDLGRDFTGSLSASKQELSYKKGDLDVVETFQKQ